MSRAQARIDEFRLALMLLTRLPAGRMAGGAPALAAAQWAFPLVGLVIGGLLWAVMQAGLAAGLPPLTAALAALALSALATGGLHHDGLADFADGVCGGRDAAHALAIMRDSRIGSYGALALIFAVMLGGSALADARPSLAAALLVAVWSRLVMLAALILLPPVRADGLGRGAGAGARPGAWVAGAVLSALLALAAGWGGLAAMAAGGGAALCIGLAARRSLGGQTGDVLGAVQLGAETAGWLALAAL